MKINQKIKKLRELKNLTQEYVASAIGISQGAYSRLELGESEINFSRLEKISVVLHMKPEEIIAFNDKALLDIISNEPEKELASTKIAMTEGEKQLYIQQIELLKEEVHYLKKLLDIVLAK
jgi:transcriptional regulator with XRE-family HTH domain